MTLDEAVSIRQNSVDEASNRLKSKAIQSQCRVYHLRSSGCAALIRGELDLPSCLQKSSAKCWRSLAAVNYQAQDGQMYFGPRPTSLKTAVAWTLRASRTFGPFGMGWGGHWNGMSMVKGASAPAGLFQSCDRQKLPCHQLQRPGKATFQSVNIFRTCFATGNPCLRGCHCSTHIHILRKP